MWDNHCHWTGFIRALERERERERERAGDAKARQAYRLDGFIFYYSIIIHLGVETYIFEVSSERRGEVSGRAREIQGDGDHDRSHGQ